MQKCQVEWDQAIGAATGLNALEHTLVLRGEVGGWVGDVVEAHSCGDLGPGQEQHAELDYRLWGTQGRC